MNFKKAFLIMLALAGSLVAGVSVGVKAQDGGSIAALYHYFINPSGQQGWRMRIDSSNRLVAEQISASPAARPQSGVNGIMIDRATGGLMFPGYTATQLAAITPSTAGVVVWNLSLNTGNSYTGGRLMVSTAAVISSWTVY